MPQPIPLKSINPAAAWSAALAAAKAAPDAVSDAAWLRVMALENEIAATPVRSKADVTLQLQVAVTMAARQGEADDPAWIMVGNALGGMNCLAER